MHDLERPADSLPVRLKRPQPRDVLSFNSYGALLRFVKSDDAIEQGGFSRSVWTDEPDNFSLFNLKGDTIICDHTPECSG